MDEESRENRKFIHSQIGSSSPPSDHPNPYSDIPTVSDDKDSDDDSIETQFDQPAQNTDAEGANDIHEHAPPVQNNTQPRHSGRSKNSQKRLIADSSWNTMSYEDPNAFIPFYTVEGKLQSLHC